MSLVFPLVRPLVSPLVSSLVGLANDTPRFSRWAFLGDSITQQIGTLTRFETRGYAAPLRFRFRQRFDIVPMVSTQHDDGIRYNHGYGTYSPDQILNGTMTDAIGASPVEPMADIAASDPPAVFVFCGSNPGASSAATAADVIAIWDVLLAAGRFVMAAEVLPRGSAQGSSVTAAIYAVNAILKPAAAARKIPYVEWADAFADSSSPEGYSNPLYTADGVHPNNLGGVVLSEILETYLDLYTPTEIPTYPTPGGAWVTANPQFVDSNADGIADGLHTLPASVTAASIIPATGGNWQRITTNHNSNTVQIIRSSSGASSNGWAVGDVVRATCEIRVQPEDLADWNLKGVQLDLVKTGGTTTSLSDMFLSTSSFSDTALTGKPYIGRFLTPPFEIPGDATGILAYFRYWGAGGSTKFEIRNLGVFKI
jgi:hypothetical protein